MSLLTQYRSIEKEIESLKSKLTELEQSPKFQNEKEFCDKLTSLMQEFDRSAPEVIKMLTPGGGKTVVNPEGRKKRKLKIYKNPNTGEVIETRGGNHKGLKSWKEQYGQDVVEGWIIGEE